MNGRAGYIGRYVGVSVARGAVLFLGAFGLLNVLGGMLRQAFDANPWWIDVDPLPAPVAHAVLLAAGALMVCWAVRPAARAWRRRATALAVLTLAGFAWVNAAVFWRVLARGEIHTPLPIPLSAVLALVLMGVALAVWLGPGPTDAGAPWMRRVLVAGAAAAAAVGFPLAQMYFLGQTDYRRPADAIVVLGALAYPDGTPSSVLEDRVRTACALYHQGLAPLLIVSGGPVTGSSTVDEPMVMRHVAVRLGVPAQAIILDHHGINTRHTVADTVALFPALGVHRVLAVSHFYHLPRVRLAYQRRGWTVCTVPAKETCVLTSMPVFIAREVLALWAYYLWPGTPGSV
jgi:vancomycin permeability regulator SanA